MSSTHNLVAQYYLAYHENSINRVNIIFSDNYTAEINGQTLNRREGIIAVSNFFDAFPDVKFTIHDSFQEGKKIVTRWTCNGSHWGEFAGYEPTQKSVQIQGITIFEINKTHIEKIWTIYDELNLFRQFEA